MCSLLEWSSIAVCPVAMFMIAGATSMHTCRAIWCKNSCAWLMIHKDNLKNHTLQWWTMQGKYYSTRWTYRLWTYDPFISRQYRRLGSEMPKNFKMGSNHTKWKCDHLEYGRFIWNHDFRTYSIRRVSIKWLEFGGILSKNDFS